ncbi:MAG: head-tail adaptor protein [Candidatus Paceibacterota bacterium]
MCTVQRPDKNEDSFGSPVKNWVTVYENILGRMRKRRGRMIANAGRDKFKTAEYLFSTHLLYLPGGLHIEDTWRVIISNEYYRIEFAEKDSSGHHWEIELSKIN